METEFTPIASAFGGALIGLASVLLLLTTGRIAGVSGILGRLLVPAGDAGGWPFRATFILGLLLAWPAWTMLADPPEVMMAVSTPLIALAGLVVGIGAAIGGGCTSGHSVCGIGRLSPRSIVATVTFMFTAGLTVLVVRHVF